MIKFSLLILVNIFCIAAAGFAYFHYSNKFSAFPEFEEHPYHAEYTSYQMDPRSISIISSDEGVFLGYDQTYVPVVFTIQSSEVNFNTFLADFFVETGDSYIPNNRCNDLFVNVDYASNFLDDTRLYITEIQCVENESAV